MHLNIIFIPKVPLLKDKFRIFQMTSIHKFEIQIFLNKRPKVFEYSDHKKDNSYLLTWEERICLGILKRTIFDLVHPQVRPDICLEVNRLSNRKVAIVQIFHYFVVDPTWNKKIQNQRMYYWCTSRYPASLNYNWLNDIRILFVKTNPAEPGVLT